jgi:hypothetical protein
MEYIAAAVVIVGGHVGLLIGVVASAAAAGSIIGAARTWQRGSASARPQSELAPHAAGMPSRWIGRRRYRRPRWRRRAALRPRARCRRIEACWLIYLALSNHALSFGDGTKVYHEAGKERQIEDLDFGAGHLG